jgi:uncharacterized protein (TIGR04255 family)
VFAVDPPGRYRLSDAPLVQALAQVRFPISARLATVEGIAPVQEGLRARYPYMAQHQQMSFEFGDRVTPDLRGGFSWELKDDAGWAVVIAPDSATLSVGSAYSGVEEFAERFEELVEVLVDVERVPRCDRLGVRYVSVAETAPGDEQAWRAWFRPDLIGWVGGEVLGDTAVLSAINQVQLSTAASTRFEGAPAVQALIRHGLVPAGSTIPGSPPITTVAVSYILDLDVSVEAPQAFAAGSLVGQFADLHGQIDGFFRWTLTPDGTAHFGLEETR